MKEYKKSFGNDIDVGALLRCDPESKSKFNTIKKKIFLGATWDIKGGKYFFI